jgi:hypothetical protein
MISRPTNPFLSLTYPTLTDNESSVKYELFYALENKSLLQLSCTAQLEARITRVERILGAHHLQISSTHTLEITPEFNETSLSKLLLSSSGFIPKATETL